MRECKMRDAQVGSIITWGVRKGKAIVLEDCRVQYFKRNPMNRNEWEAEASGQMDRLHPEVAVAIMKLPDPHAQAK